MNGYFSLPAKIYERLVLEGKEAAGKRERGGIFIGQYRGPHIEITDMTFPGRRDRANLFSFTRRDREHQRAALAAWQGSECTKTYVGEWHSHPWGSAIPSSIDDRTWARLTKSAKSTLLFSIVTPTDIRFFRGVLVVKSKRQHFTLEQAPFGPGAISDENASYLFEPTSFDCAGTDVQKTEQARDEPYLARFLP